MPDVRRSSGALAALADYEGRGSWGADVIDLPRGPGLDEMPEQTPAMMGAVNRAVDGVTRIVERIERDLKDDIRRREIDEKEHIAAIMKQIAELAEDHKKTREGLIEMQQERARVVFGSRLLKMVAAGIFAILGSGFTFAIIVVNYLQDTANFRVVLEEKVDEVRTEQRDVKRDLQQILPEGKQP
jgi:hypothetical protein